MKVLDGEERPLGQVSPDAGGTLLETLRDNGFDVDAPCGGIGICGKCRVQIRRRGSDIVEEVLACTTDPNDVDTVWLPTRHDIDALGQGPQTVWDDMVPAPGLGVAIDVGTTTLALDLVSRETGRSLAVVTAANPQVTFGADVISRIGACGEGYLAAMRDGLAGALRDMIRRACKMAGKRSSDISCCVVSGNTTMECIAAGTDPSPIGRAPFTPPSLFGKELDGPIAQAPAFFMPCISGYVGGDIVAGALACGLDRTDDVVILLDLGTNGEMVLSNVGQLSACATAAGPVFEGAGIQCGMRAIPGAVTRVWIENGTLRCDTVGDCEPMGLCGTGLISAISLLLGIGLVDETGLFEPSDEGALPYIAKRAGFDAFLIAPEVFVTQADIRKFQLAKAAIQAGMQTILEEAGLGFADVDRILVAGGFGAHLDRDEAVITGLIPLCLRSKMTWVGNSSLEGSRGVLISPTARQRAMGIARSCTYLELSTSPRFNELYIDAMIFGEND